MSPYANLSTNRTKLNRPSGNVKRICLLAPAFLALFLIASANPRDARPQSVDPGLTAHEWGTFTSIAGNDGAAVEWSPLSGPKDLPGFVEHLRTPNFKLGLRGTVRMETPVLYFYSTHENSVSVHVSFSHGYITEWYPHAESIAPATSETSAVCAGNDQDGSVTWNSVALTPGSADEPPREERESPYYAARETASTPLFVKASAGEEREKFLFYRGVSSFAVPISARIVPVNRVLMQNLSQQPIPSAILFERRGDKIGYRVLSPLQDTAAVEFPELSGSIKSLRADFEAILVSQGLNQDEAHAMLETWRDSWFEQGSRVFYIVPKPFVDSVLPLTISPAPAETVRVFVGRVELVTPATENEVARAFAANDRETLQSYARFLEPILTIMIERESDPERVATLQDYLGTVYRSMFAQNR
jgi:hypothetical protein